MRLIEWRIKNIFIPGVAGLVGGVRRRNEQRNGAAQHLLAHLGDGIVKNSTRIIRSFSEQFHLKNEKPKMLYKITSTLLNP